MHILLCSNLFVQLDCKEATNLFKFATFYYALIVLFFAITMIIFPDQTYEASIRGLTLWTEIVFPSLLPFFIIAELLLAFGVVRLIGILLEPLMRPLFNLPGAGGVAIAMGLVSGYPSGAKIATRLYEEKAISTIEAERLIAFTNASNPLFIFGAVAIGFFHNPTLGWLIAISHYGASLLVGVCMRFYYRNSDTRNEKTNHYSSSSLGEKIKHTLSTPQPQQQKPLGQHLGDAVYSSVKTLVMIGGFIILFSVINKLLFLSGVSEWLSSILEKGLQFISQPGELALPIISGIFEITLGAQMVAQTDQATLFVQVIFVSLLLAFNGLSIHSQVASIIANTEIRYKPYLIGRLLHMVWAVILVFLLYQPVYLERQTSNPQDVPVDTSKTADHWVINLLNDIQTLGPFITSLTILVTVWLIIKNTTQRTS